MTDEQRKALTLYLGECWHSIRGQAKQTKDWYCTCMAGRVSGYHEKEYLEAHCTEQNRPFTTDADMMALFRKMVDDGQWYLFENSILVHDKYQTTRNKRLSQKYPDGYFSAWLFYDPERFCCLVAQWLMEVKK